jgi:thiamine-phosphate pyrophosphorylase
MRRRPLPLDLYLITDRRLAGPRGVETVVEEAVRGGVTAVQLRDDQPAAELIAQARRLKAILAPQGVPLIVNNRLDVALAAGADGAHVGQSDTPVAEARARLGPDAILGLSITDPAQLAGLDEEAVDYLGIGPVFPTGTKPDADPPMGLEGLESCRPLTALPILAIGGADEPERAARELAEAVREAKQRRAKS